MVTFGRKLIDRKEVKANVEAVWGASFEKIEAKVKEEESGNTFVLTCERIFHKYGSKDFEKCFEALWGQVPSGAQKAITFFALKEGFAKDVEK